MKDFRTVIYYKSEDALDGVDFDNLDQFATEEGRFLGLAHDIVEEQQRTFAVIEDPDTQEFFYIDFKLLIKFKN